MIFILKHIKEALWSVKPENKAFLLANPSWRSLLYLLILSLSPLLAKAQLAIISDPDGYTNVREKGDIRSPVNFKIYDDQVFTLVDWGTSKRPKWLPLKMSQAFDTLRCKDTKFQYGYMHDSRILELKDFENQFETTVQENLAFVETDKLKVELTVNPKPKRPDYKTCLLGTDQGVGELSNQLKSLSVNINGKPITIPEEDLKYLYIIDLSSFDVFQQGNLTILYVGTRSVACFYQCAWVIKDGEYLKRYLYFGE